MALQTKIPCMCADDWYVDHLHPNYRQYPQLCPFCNGTKEFEVDITFNTFHGKFKKPREWFENYQEDIWMGFDCPCGDKISMSEGGYTACSCGRVYQLSISLTVDKTHLGDTQFLIDEYHQERKRFLDKFTKKDDTV